MGPNARNTPLLDKSFKQILAPHGPLLVGHGVMAKLERILLELDGGSDILVIADETTYKIASDLLLNAVPDGRVEFHLIEQASVEEVYRSEQVLLTQGSTVVVGLGGGCPVDVAKLTAFRHGLPFVSVPTSLSHDGIASGRASLTHLGAKTSIGARPPASIIADLDILSNAPPRLAASGCADIISNLTAVMDWELANRMTGEAIHHEAMWLARKAGEAVSAFDGPVLAGDDDKISSLVMAIVMSGKAMALANTSRPASGAEHKFAHTMDVLLPHAALHGELCGIGSCLTMYLHRGDWKGIRDSLVRVGAPVSTKELNIGPEVVTKALAMSGGIRPERYTILEHVSIDAKKAESTVLATGVLD